MEEGVQIFKLTIVDYFFTLYRMSYAAKVSIVVASSEGESMNKLGGISLRPRVVLTGARLFALVRSNLIRCLDWDPLSM